MNALLPRLPSKPSGSSVIAFPVSDLHNRENGSGPRVCSDLLPFGKNHEQMFTRRVDNCCSRNRRGGHDEVQARTQGSSPESPFDQGDEGGGIVSNPSHAARVSRRKRTPGNVTSDGNTQPVAGSRPCSLHRVTLIHTPGELVPFLPSPQGRGEKWTSSPGVCIS